MPASWCLRAEGLEEAGGGGDGDDALDHEDLNVVGWALLGSVLLARQVAGLLALLQHSEHLLAGPVALLQPQHVDALEVEAQ